MLPLRSDSTVEFSAGGLSTFWPKFAVDAGLCRGSDLVQPASQIRARPDGACGCLKGAARLQYRKIAEQWAGHLKPDRQPVDEAAWDRARRVLGQIERRGIGRPARKIGRVRRIVVARIGISRRDRHGRRQQQVELIEEQPYGLPEGCTPG